MSVVIAPVTLRWARREKFKPMPPEVREVAERNGQLLYYLKYSLIIFILLLWMKAISMPLLILILPHRSWTNVLLAALIGTTWLLICKAAWLRSYPRIKTGFLNHGSSRVSSGHWQTIFVLGGIAEETWRGFVICSFRPAPQGQLIAVLASSLAFVYGRASGLPSRMLGIREDALWEFFLGIILAMLYVYSGSIVTSCAVNIFVSFGEQYLLRRSTRIAGGTGGTP
jgi:CAAX prenyl protease-like protein